MNTPIQHSGRRRTTLVSVALSPSSSITGSSPANTSALIEELYSNILLVADQGREPATAPQN